MRVLGRSLYKLGALVSVLILILLGIKIAGPKNPYPIRKNSLLQTVAITQIIEHAALDLERKGVLEVLKEEGFVEGENLKIIYQNAQGNSVTATQIGQKFASLKPEVVVAISTPSAQSMLAALGHNPIPLVFSAVTDPIAARLVGNLEHPGLGISGVSDYLSPEPQLQLIKQILPAVKSLGILYNSGETNSNILYRALQSIAPSYKINILAATANRTSEVAAAAQSLVGRVDALYIPNDNTAVSAIESIVRIGILHQLPVFAGDTGSIGRGAIGGAGYNRIQMGRAAGKRVVQFLRKGYSQEIPIEISHPIEIMLNRAAAQKMNVLLPADLASNVRWIGDLP